MRLMVVLYGIIHIGLYLVSPAAQGAEPQFTSLHKGINLYAMKLPAVGTYDIDLLASDQALEKMQLAIDLIYKQSPFSVYAFERLKKAGKVTVVYDPDFPKERFSSVTIAAFFPDFFQKEGHLKEFLVVIGRYGIKWPLDKLAAVIVHELGGHGYQHLRGRTEQDRKIDRECEALLYEEAALQDFNVVRSTDDMVRFRHNMQTNWCSDFRRYMHDRDPKLMATWNSGKPDVPELLKVFEDYLVHLRQSGVSGKAVAAVKNQRQSDLDAMASEALQKNHGPDLFAVAQRYMNGIGTQKDLPEARKWFFLAANTGFGPAQFVMGALEENGVGGEKNPVNAYTWYLLASQQGMQKAAERLAPLASQLTEQALRDAKDRAATWKPNNKIKSGLN